MLAKTKYIVFAATLAVLAGCSTPTAKLDPDASGVHLRLDAQFNADDCQWLGEVTGSEGHWYSYIFFPNDVMVRGALNDIKNQAFDLGANTVYLVQPQDFISSFTVMGNAYNCPEKSSNQ
ncbi:MULTISPECIES: DUF4156 domain-containing protein [Vibrio]|uniref:DUF4156 domain-containing protein n=1 Tax=Vibrio bivalvicida TaxID=1276888 RepID=A0A177XWC9_9VIBR|nr:MULTISPECIES: DUF4156 domain-containing protein [Vibrio]KLN62935.1 membrane protein [Vibrio sp. VPAP30]OAJ92924.1 hypothetical protein APB76_17145 [Vibrio bivalvicida]